MTFFIDFDKSYSVSGLPIKKTIRLPEKIVEKIPEKFRPSPSDPFEIAVSHILKNPKVIHHLNVQAWSKDLTTAGFLRVLSILILHGDPHLDEVLRKQFLLILDDIDSRSQNLWLERLKRRRLANSQIEFKLIRANREISFHQASLSLAKKKTLWNLIEVLSRNSTVTLETVTHELWSSSYDESYFHRIRMLAYNLSEILTELTAEQDLVRVTKNDLSLKEGVKIIII